MSIKTTIGRVLGVKSDAGHVDPKRVGLALPNLDERATIYLRAIHRDRDFSGEEVLRARAIILDAMRDDVGLRSKGSSEPEDVPEGIDIGASEEAGHWAMASMEALPRASMMSAARYSLPVPPSMVSRGHALTEAAWSAHDRETKKISRTSKNRTFTYSALAAVLAVVIVAPVVWFANYADSGGPNFSAVSSNLGQVSEVSSKRDKLTSNVQSAIRVEPQGSNEVKELKTVSPWPANVGPPAERSTSVQNQLLERGRQLLAARNIEEARPVLKQAADMGSASAALLLGETYDPIELRRLGIIQNAPPDTALAAKTKSFVIENASPDIALARYWYAIAKELGSPDAVKRLERLSSLPR